MKLKSSFECWFFIVIWNFEIVQITKSNQLSDYWSNLMDTKSGLILSLNYKLNTRTKY